tara:strand:+ start:279 stop:1115 length:837 start_codon:yes stop_codon:yes gene_type:complete
MNNLCIIILTYNEELNIKKCLKSIKDFADEIIIIDSGSNDKTKNICEEFTVKFVHNKFINQAQQFNWALKNLEIKSEWIMRLDADEEVSESLAHEIKKNIKNENKINGFYINRRLIWCGKWIKYGGIYPLWIARIFRKGKAVYEERTEEHLIIDGKTDKIKGDLVENNLKNKIEFFTLKHIETAKGEVREIFDKKFDKNISSDKFINKNKLNRFFKINLFNKMPLFIRSLIYFIYRYIFRFGFLDGKAGFTFHFFQAFWYRMFIDMLANEKKNDDEKK